MEEKRFVGGGVPVIFQVTYLGHVIDPWGKERVGLEAHASLDRKDWGFTCISTGEQSGRVSH